MIAEHGGTFLTPAGRTGEPIEGDWSPQTLTIVEFPNVAAAKALIDSPAFRDAVAIRKATEAVFKIVLVDGSPA